MSDSIKTNLAAMSDRVSLYEFTDELRPVFDNKSRNEAQLAPKDWFNSTHSFVLDWYREGEGWLVQCAFCLLPSYENNHYIIWIYDWTKKNLYHVIFASHTVYPPVWDRGFGGLDYTDYVSIQRKIKNIMERHDMVGFVVDETLEGKFVHMTQETPDEIKRLLAEGKRYSIIALKAEAARDKLTLTSIRPHTA